MMKKIFFFLFLSVAVSCEDIIGVEDISDNRIILIAPSDNVVVPQSTINFSWEALDEAESYQIQVATQSFEQAVQVLVDSIVNDPKVTIELNSNTVYEWRVRGSNSEFNTQYFNSFFSTGNE